MLCSEKQLHWIFLRQSEIKRLSDVIEKQWEQIVALREENKFLQGVCTAHVTLENSNSTALYNVNSYVNADAETAFIQSIIDEKTTKSIILANPGGELSSEIESHSVSAENLKHQLTA